MFDARLQLDFDFSLCGILNSHLTYSLSYVVSVTCLCRSVVERDEIKSIQWSTGAVSVTSYPFEAEMLIIALLYIEAPYLSCFSSTVTSQDFIFVSGNT